MNEAKERCGWLCEGGELQCKLGAGHEGLHEWESPYEMLARASAYEQDVANYEAGIQEMPTMPSDSGCEIQDEISSVNEAKEQGNRTEADLEFKYRRLLWLTHGHSGLYGDDGEMQCGTCAPIWDYKNAPLEKVEEAYQLAILQRAAFLSPFSPSPVVQSTTVTGHESYVITDTQRMPLQPEVVQSAGERREGKELLRLGVVPLGPEQITPEIRLLASRCIIASDKETDVFSRDAHKYAAYTIIRERQLASALAQVEELRKERDEAQRAKYGTPCRCESWMEVCRIAEERVEELESQVALLQQQEPPHLVWERAYRLAADTLSKTRRITYEVPPYTPPLEQE